LQEPGQDEPAAEDEAPEGHAVFGWCGAYECAGGAARAAQESQDAGHLDEQRRPLQPLQLVQDPLKDEMNTTHMENAQHNESPQGGG
jgi:hypothetical protein